MKIDIIFSKYDFRFDIKLDLNQIILLYSIFLTFIVYNYNTLIMNIYKSIGRLSAFRFSTSVIEILNKFDEDYYVKNFLNTFNSTGFP